MNSGWVAATYLIYIILWVALTLGGCGYAVFVRGHSGWWFVLAVILASCAYRPEAWVALAGRVP
jgi:hypothetical protein